jgi:hypothetical protein
MKFVIIDLYVLVVDVSYFLNLYFRFFFCFIIGLELTSTNPQDTTTHLTMMDDSTNQYTTYDSSLLNEDITTLTSFQYLPTDYRKGLYK